MISSKRTKILVYIIFFLLLSVSVSFGQKYEFKSAYIEKISTTSSSGVEITKQEKIYIDNFGEKEVHYIKETQNISMANMKTEEETVSIIDGDWIISYNPETKEGTKMKFEAGKMFSGMSEDQMKKLAEQMGDAMKTKTKEIGTMEIAGKSCKGTEAVTDMMGMKTTTKIWQYGNFSMKSESNSMGTKFNEEVTKFDEGINVSPDDFKVPSDIKISEVNSQY